MILFIMKMYTTMQPTRLSHYAAKFRNVGAMCGYSVRNSGEIEAFARGNSDPVSPGVGDDVINHFVFLACHAERPIQPQMIDVKGNFICFNYAGLSSLGRLSPSMLKNNFFGKIRDYHEKPINKSRFYKDILVPFKDENLAPGSPISLYRSNEGYQIADLYVLCNGTVFHDEMTNLTQSGLKENPGSLIMVSFDGNGNLVGYANLLDTSNLQHFRENGLDIVDNYSSGRCSVIWNTDHQEYILTMAPYEVRTDDAHGNGVYRPLLLSEVFNIIQHAIYPYWFNPQFNPRNPDGSPGMTIDEYMKKHLVLTTNGCRCIEGDPPILGRTQSTGHLGSSALDAIPRGGKTRPKRRHNRRKSVKNDKNKNRKKKTRHTRTH